MPLEGISTIVATYLGSNVLCLVDNVWNLGSLFINNFYGRTTCLSEDIKEGCLVWPFRGLKTRGVGLCSLIYNLN